MPPMAVPMRMPQRAGSSWLSGVSHVSPACSRAYGSTFHTIGMIVSDSVTHYRVLHCHAECHGTPVRNASADTLPCCTRDYSRAWANKSDHVHGYSTVCGKGWRKHGQHLLPRHNGVLYAAVQAPLHLFADVAGRAELLNLASKARAVPLRVPALYLCDAAPALQGTDISAVVATSCFHLARELRVSVTRRGCLGV